LKLERAPPFLLFVDVFIYKYLFGDISVFAGKVCEVFMKGIGASYFYEGYSEFKTEEV